VSLLEAFHKIRLGNHGASPRADLLIPSRGSPRGLPAPESICQFVSIQARAIVSRHHLSQLAIQHEARLDTGSGAFPWTLRSPTTRCVLGQSEGVLPQISEI